MTFWESEQRLLRGAAHATVTGASVGVGSPTNPTRYVWGMGTAQATRAQAMVLRRMADDLARGDVFHQAGREAAEIIADNMRRHLRPKSKSGGLIGTVRVVGAEVMYRSGSNEGVVIPAHVLVGNEQVPYAGVVQGGWPKHGIPAYPYMTWAINEAENDVMGVIQDAIDKLDRRYQQQLSASRFLTGGMRSSFVHPARFAAFQVRGVSGAAEAYIRSYIASEIRMSRRNWRAHALRDPKTGRFVSRSDYPNVAGRFIRQLAGV